MRAVAFVLAGVVGSSALAQDPRAAEFDPTTRAAVDRGLAWLVAKQNPNGSWTNRVGYKLYDDYFGEENESVDVTAISGMALLAGGHVPGRGQYGKHAWKAVEWLLSKVRDEDGYITHAGSRMYSHAFATLFLAEVYGMTRREVIKPKLKRAVDLIVNSQNREGGWRYQPIPVDADLSVTVSTLQALRAARNVGISVPKDTVARAARYVENCATRRGFTYQSVAGYGISDTRVSYALTACGLVSLYSAGQYDSPRVREALRVLPDWRHTLIPGRLHYYYGHYYAAQAMYVAGGEHWQRYYPEVKREILRMQFEDGHWEDDVGPAYATAMACVILQIPCEYLPIFQK
ncbi:MAG TPA: prenyltransferase/squalene oxidase repeat-containing protein [Planctomycetota bacterium]|nr:prenyltransferase/squalene oxidase repeat-containing protein [Planctomycetota bacterium]